MNPNMASQPPKKKSKKANRTTLDSEELERIDSLSWNPSLPHNDDPFSLFIGSNELKGGFLTLEEIDEAEYGLKIPKLERADKKERPTQTTRSRKRKRKEDGDGLEIPKPEKANKKEIPSSAIKLQKGEQNKNDDGSSGGAKAGSEKKVGEETKKVKKLKKRKKKKQKSKKKEEKESEGSKKPAAAC